ncbi:MULTISPECIES: DUF4232 domain-containing protein [unclassified Streptomyces]|uniref:DUF4232 domain-containing protein n=1 Tax=unclassified Streptomyces TaxID=2593676 RepID=UPI002DD7AFBA|nr:DUF4232 domain-containing protein [Streptomyces sp. NBC_01445]WSE02598.1 DUF4232 domain-containing protein [Streptomyces sp. NBC_01445]
MRVQKLSLLAVAVVAGLSLTACQSGGDSSAGSDDSSSSARSSGSQSSGSQDSGGSSASTGNGTSTAGSDASTGGSSNGGSGTGTGACQTSHLAFSSSGGMAEGTLVVNLKNTGSATCTLKGFPGADLKGKDGTVSAERSKLAPPSVSVKPGEETRFTLHYPSNDSGGSGVTFTSLVVTPPNETHSHTLPVTINVPATDGSGPAITVDPVGTGK